MKDRIKLRALTYNDIEKTLKWHNQEEVKYFYSGHPFPVNIENEKEWYEKILKSNIPTSVFGVEHIEDKKLIGFTILKKINLINRNAEFGKVLGEKKYQGIGVGTEMTLKTLKFGFHELGLKRIYAYQLHDNFGSIKVNEKCGFIKEGILRSAVFKNNKFIDEQIMSILKEDFDKIWKEKYGI